MLSFAAAAASADAAAAAAAADASASAADCHSCEHRYSFCHHVFAGWMYASRKNYYWVGGPALWLLVPHREQRRTLASFALR